MLHQFRNLAENHPQLESLANLTQGQLDEARYVVANFWRTTSWLIYMEDHYASHVTESTKIQHMIEDEQMADEIEQGKHDQNFTISQRIIHHLTGISIPLLGN